MQEEIEQKSISVTIKAAKLTGATLAKALRATMNKIKAGSKPKHGKQTIKQLAKHNTGLSNVEINDGNIKCFEPYARKYGIDYALMRDNETPPKWLVFFKSRDTDAMTAAFSEFSRNTLRREHKPSVREGIRKFKELLKSTGLERQHRQRERGDRGGPDL